MTAKDNSIFIPTEWLNATKQSLATKRRGDAARDAATPPAKRPSTNNTKDETTALRIASLMMENTKLKHQIAVLEKFAATELNKKEHYKTRYSQTCHEMRLQVAFDSSRFRHRVLVAEIERAPRAHNGSSYLRRRRFPTLGFPEGPVL